MSIDNQISTEEMLIVCDTEVNIHVQFTLLMCWVGGQGKLVDFRYLEGGRKHSIRAVCSCDCVFVCFRPQEKVPVYLTDLTTEEDIVCAYIPPLHLYGAMGTSSLSISISDISGTVVSSFSVSCSVGSQESAPLIHNVDTTTQSPSVQDNKTFCHIPLETTPSIRCPCSLSSDGYLSPEIVRNKSPPQLLPTLGFELLQRDPPNIADSPVSISGSWPEAVDFNSTSMERGVMLKEEEQIKEKEEILDNNVIFSEIIMSTSETEETTKQCVPLNPSTVPSFSQLSDEERAQRKVLQAKAKTTHENIKQSILALDYSKEEAAAVKCCLTEFAKAKHPELNNFELSDKIQCYVTKDIIATLDVDKRLCAIRASKINKWVAEK
jgi:hypothetical protein